MSSNNQLLKRHKSSQNDQFQKKFSQIPKYIYNPQMDNTQKHIKQKIERSSQTGLSIQSNHSSQSQGIQPSHEQELSPYLKFQLPKQSGKRHKPLQYKHHKISEKQQEQSLLAESVPIPINKGLEIQPQAFSDTFPSTTKERKNIGFIVRQKQIHNSQEFTSSQLQASDVASNQKVHNIFAISLLGLRKSRGVALPKVNRYNRLTNINPQNKLKQSEYRRNESVQKIAKSQNKKGYQSVYIPRSSKISSLNKSHKNNQNLFSKTQDKIELNSQLPFEPSRLNLLKQQINYLADQRKSKNATPTESTIHQETKNRQEQFGFSSSKKHNYQNYIVSFGTSLQQLQKICYQSKTNPQIYETVQISLPSFFETIYITPHTDPPTIHALAYKIYTELNVPIKNLQIKKYSNCIILNNYPKQENSYSLAFIYHYDSKIYLGQWVKNEKYGIGLQWKPGKYVYYGQYRENKRDGFGIMKDSDGTTYMGKWKKGWKVSNYM